MQESTFEMASKFFGGLNHFVEGQKELRRIDKVIQFQVRDDQSFWLNIRNGSLTLNIGMAPPDQVGVTFSPDRETLVQLFQRKLRYVDVVPFMGSPSAARMPITPFVARRGILASWVGKLIRIAQGLPKVGTSI